MNTYSLRHRRLGTQVAMIMALPVSLVFALAIPQVKNSFALHSAKLAEEKRAALYMRATALARDLENERDAFSVASGQITDDVAERRRITDATLGDFRKAVASTTGVPAPTSGLGQAEKALKGIPKARAGDFATRSSVLPASSAYTEIIDALSSVIISAGQDAGDTDSLRAAYALAVGASALSSQRALINSPTVESDFTDDETTFLSEKEGVRRLVSREFHTASASLGLAASELEVDGSCLVGPGGKDVVAQRPVPARWFACSSRVLDHMHAVEANVLERALESASAKGAEAQQDLVRHTVLGTIALLASVVVAVLTTRQLIRRMHRLRRTALKAQNELAAFVQKVSRSSDPSRLQFSVELVDGRACDEVGDLAQAFDAVVKEAIAQIAQQAVLRAAVRAKLASMSRRVLVLVHRQLDLLSSMHMTEQHPTALKNLFRLDHLATLMRRHGETMLVLAGEDAGRRYERDAPLVDVLRAAAAEVEDYARAVVQEDIPSVCIEASAVHGMTHMMAELVENAVKYSHPNQPVRLSAEETATGDVLVRVSDSGIGIPQGQLDSLNIRLQSELPADWVQSERSGLDVVNYLASSHGARVYLDSTDQGTTALVVLSADVIVAASAAHLLREPHAGTC
ncbi:nitrate- and nitrite sensing domain-containing protein [Streptomyces sp. NPDC096198]|uniref:sensor histidine kinase n=1 Tax=Streptomyces sp. NPDC096198 TaxID=3366080 RepID=UPI0037FB8B79